MMKRAALVLVACSMAVSVMGGCTVAQKKSVAKVAVNNMSAEDRRESFEATARLLDENPGLGDEAYAVMKKHPKAMAHLIDIAAKDLENPEIAKFTASVIVKQPGGLQAGLEAIVDASMNEPPARAAINRGAAAKATQMVEIVSDDPQAMAKMVGGGMKVIATKPKAKVNALIAVHANRKSIIELVKNDKELAKEMTEVLLREAVKDKPALEKLLRATGAIDDDGAAKAKEPPAAPPPPPAK